MPDSRDVLEARADVTFFLTLTALDAHDLVEVRRQTARLRSFADDLETRSCGSSPNGRTGLADAIAGDVQSGLARVGGGRLRGCRERLGGEWRHGVPGGLDRCGVRARLQRGRALDRRGRALRRLDRAVALRPPHALDPGDGVVGRRRPGRGEATRPPSHRRQGLQPRHVHGALGAGLRGTGPRRARRARLPSSTDALDIRDHERARSS